MALAKHLKFTLRVALHQMSSLAHLFKQVDILLDVMELRPQPQFVVALGSFLCVVTLVNIGLNDLLPRLVPQRLAPFLSVNLTIHGVPRRVDYPYTMLSGAFDFELTKDPHIIIIVL